jgi:hypothetical protein
MIYHDLRSPLANGFEPDVLESMLPDEEDPTRPPG